MQTQVKLPDYKNITLTELAKLWPWTVDALFQAACEGDLQIGVLSNGWALRSATPEQALFNYTSVIHETDELMVAFKQTFGDNFEFGATQSFIQEPFALLREDLINLRNTGRVKTSYVTSFDQDKYFYISRRSDNDIRYRDEHDDEGLLLTRKDVEHLIITSTEKEKFEAKSNLNSINSSKSVGQIKEINNLAAVGLMAFLLSEKISGCKTASGPNVSAISTLTNSFLIKLCEEKNCVIPHGFSSSALAKKLSEGIDKLLEFIEEGRK